MNQRLVRWKSPPESGSVTSDFKYGILKNRKTGIRLARILPGSGNQGISIQLDEAFLTGTGREPYDALSYTWGDHTQLKNVTCNGKRLAITQSLFEALHRFRSVHEVVTLWIDQICICQDRILERNLQVQLMDQIFINARKVLVWLGSDDGSSKAGMQLAQQLLHISKTKPGYRLTPADYEAHGLPKRGHKRWRELSKILQRPWFSRTWVIQEVVLNPVVEVVLGMTTLTWEELESVVRLLESGPEGTVWDFMQAIDASELAFTRINRIRLRHRGLISTPVDSVQIDTMIECASMDVYTLRRQESIGLGEHPELLDLLMMSRGPGVTDSRDKIFALLGMSKHDIVPDYSMSPESIFNQFAQQLVGNVTSLISQGHMDGSDGPAVDREVARFMLFVSCAGRHNQNLKLHSWVPDWTVNLRSRPLSLAVEGPYTAGGSELGLFDWHHDWGLQLCGRLLDVVARAGSVDLQYDPGEDLSKKHDIIKRWAAEASQIAETRTSFARGCEKSQDSFKAMLRHLSLCKHGYYSGGLRRRRNSLLDDFDGSDEFLHDAFHTLAIGPTRGRVVFTTTTGFIGLGPRCMRHGDLVYIVMGVNSPWILRPFEDAYELIGEAYVEGAMHGEVMRMDHNPIVDLGIR